MKKLLHIVATPREEESRTLQVTEAYLEAFKSCHSGWVIEELNLSKEKLPSLTMKVVNGKYVLLSGKHLFGDMKDAWEEILHCIDQFLSADLYLISTPMWNFNIPYMLKHYIDVIVQPEYLFRYSEKGAVEGLVKDKKMIVIASRGGNYTGDRKDYDFQEPYLRAVFGFVGITDIEFVIAQPMDNGIEIQELNIQEAKLKAHKLGLKI
jgi:FMN-dependent NADH-azoreductase